MVSLSLPAGSSTTPGWNSGAPTPPTCMQWNTISIGSLRSWFPSSQPLEVPSLPSRLRTSFHSMEAPPEDLERSISDSCTRWEWYAVTLCCSEFRLCWEIPCCVWTKETNASRTVQDVGLLPYPTQNHAMQAKFTVRMDSTWIANVIHGPQSLR